VVDRPQQRRFPDPFSPASRISGATGPPPSACGSSGDEYGCDRILRNMFGCAGNLQRSHAARTMSGNRRTGLLRNPATRAGSCLSRRYRSLAVLVHPANSIDSTRPRLPGDRICIRPAVFTSKGCQRGGGGSAFDR
jgi:hypothetical protein